MLRTLGVTSWLFAVGAGAAPPAPEAAKGAAQGFLSDLKGHRYDEALARCDQRMKDALIAHPLKEIWEGFEAEVGPLESLGLMQVEPKGEYLVVSADGDFKRARRQLRVSVSGGGEISGLFWTAMPNSLEPRAKKLVEQLRAGDFEGAERGFGPQLSRALPAKALAQAWQQLAAQAGKLQAIDGVTLEPVGTDYTVAWVQCRFDRGPMRVKAVYDVKERLEGLFFLPGEAPQWAPPAYARADAFDERKVVVKATGVDLPGFLTVPKGDGPFPAVVLVHGSGPSDADESVGAVKVFRDLAFGLASQGVLVLRYDKRTHVSKAPVATVEDEVIDGARAAVKLVAGLKEVDPRHVTVVGHSQGAYLAPRIAKEVKGVTAVVMLAAPARSLDALLDEQLELLTRGADPQTRAAVLEKQKSFKAQLHSPALKASDDVALPTGGSVKGSYFLDLRSYDPVKAAVEAKVPLMLLQGGRDYQVSAERDFGLFQKALTGKPNVLLRQFPALNHLMVSGSGPSTPAEYEQPGHVDVDVVTTIAAFARPNVHKNP